MQNATELYSRAGLKLITRSPRVRQTGFPPLSVVLCYCTKRKMYITRCEALRPNGALELVAVTNEFQVSKAKGGDARAFAKAVDDYIARGKRLGAFINEVPATQQEVA